VWFTEHHVLDDGHLPNFVPVAGAVAAVTERVRISTDILLAPFAHPIRLAEDLAILDVISNGRVEATLGIGYRPHEYRMFGIDKSRRVQVLDEVMDVLEQAWTGEPFAYRGETVVVRPTPVQRPRPPLYIGGSSPASALRAAHRGDNYFPAGTPGLRRQYEAERERLGLPVPPRPPAKGPLFLHVSEDPERDWPVVFPHVAYTSNANSTWSRERGVGATPYPPIETVDDLKASPQFAVVTPEECVALATRLGDDAELTFQPLMGAMPPEIGWRSLRLFESAVLPALRAARLRS
jgi:alkanesulfonate monooxygenase SsuD/methylene tetrahydromethanopterin reductase-like flavin-dependent oxidoreductase (luciferase family)